jgi:RNA polymerase sigma factor (sigma-70 family)
VRAAGRRVTKTSAGFTGENLLRELAPQVLGAVIRRFGDFSAGEDAVQEALLAAAVQWPADGVPDNPRGWLIQVAARRMTDHIRAELARRRRETVAATQAVEEQIVPAPDSAVDAEQDDTLILLFMCCHPALTRTSAIALTLRAIGGLTTAEIANAFLVPEATMAQRISRAKQTIKKSGVPFSLPGDRERAERLDAVLHVLYLIFNEGYATSIGSTLQRSDLANEAIRLTRAVHNLLPKDGEVAGLLALMLLTDARRAARTGPDGELIPLAEQDRSLWDRDAISEGVALITETLARGSIGAYQLQAAIAAIHDEAPRAADTDWPQILALYGLLKRMSDNPMVTLNHAIAAAMVHGPATGLELLDRLDADPRIDGHYRLDAVRAHLLEMSGNHQGAIARYRAAASRTASIPERNYLATQAARLSAGKAPQAAEITEKDGRGDTEKRS